MRVDMLCAFRALCGCGATSARRMPILSKRFGRFTSGSATNLEIGKSSQKRRARAPSTSLRAGPPHTRSVLVHFADDGDASVGCVADYVFELDGGVMDFEFTSQTVIDRPQNRVALGSRDI